MAAQTSIKGQRKARVGTEENTSEHPLCIKKECVYDTGRGVYPSASLKKSFLNTIWKEIDHFAGLVFWLKRSSYGTSDLQGCYSPKEISYIIYSLIHERDQIPCRTTYIEYRSLVKISIHFSGTPPNSIGFHCKIFFFIVPRHRSLGVPFSELEKIIF